jgi:hypothetical protein
MKKTLLILLFSFSSIFSSEFNEDECISGLSRSNNIPEESINGASDPYFEGYIQALVDMHFYEYKVVVLVKDHTVWLANVPKNKLLAKSIISFVKDVPGVKKVKVLDGVPPKDIIEREKYVNRPRVSGIWFPQSTQLYQTMIANPRSVIYGIGYRGGDKVIGKTVIYVSLGDDFPIFRWIDVFSWQGDLQISIEAGIWSVFDMKPSPNINGGTALVNTDFYCGIPITYAVNKWAFRFRVYHQSSHLGDEFLVNHPGFNRLNPSFEAIDFFTSCQATDAIRIYAGPGFIIHSDSGYFLDRWYVEYGGEARFWGRKIDYHKLYGNFIIGFYLRNWQYLHWDIDGTYVAGYEISKLQGIGRKIRILASYHHGFSLEGQFSKQRTSYGTIGFAYGF